MYSTTSPEEYYIARCLELAELAKGETSPNPMVGAIVLNKNGKKVAEGFHAKAGSPHAEVIALNLAGSQAEGGTLYINLEPCAHTGRTPPCTEKVTSAGIKQVICGTLDPNPLVAGKGRDFLQNHGISVRVGYLETECHQLNEAFFHAIQHKMPFVTVKHGMTLDGKIADREGTSQWITSAIARKAVHLLRSNQDAIITTAQTVAQDHCRLTVREVPERGSAPVRIVLDRRARLNPNDYAIFDTQEAPTWLVVSSLKHNASHVKAAEKRGCRILEVSEAATGLSLKEALKAFHKEGMQSILVEAGGTLAGSLQEEGLIQKWALFMAGKMLPDPQAQSFVESSAIRHLKQAHSLNLAKVHRLGPDAYIEAYPN